MKDCLCHWDQDCLAQGQPGMGPFVMVYSILYLYLRDLSILTLSKSGCFLQVYMHKYLLSKHSRQNYPAHLHKSIIMHVSNTTSHLHSQPCLTDPLKPHHSNPPYTFLSSKVSQLSSKKKMADGQHRVGVTKHMGNACDITYAKLL